MAYRVKLFRSTLRQQLNLLDFFDALLTPSLCPIWNAVFALWMHHSSLAITPFDLILNIFRWLDLMPITLNLFGYVELKRCRSQYCVIRRLILAAIFTTTGESPLIIATYRIFPDSISIWEFGPIRTYLVRTPKLHQLKRHIKRE